MLSRKKVGRKACLTVWTKSRCRCLKVKCSSFWLRVKVNWKKLTILNLKRRQKKWMIRLINWCKNVKIWERILSTPWWKITTISQSINRQIKDWSSRKKRQLSIKALFNRNKLALKNMVYIIRRNRAQPTWLNLLKVKLIISKPGWTLQSSMMT